jgi:hypothetical protein
MSEASFGLKVSWFLYQKGLMSVAKPDFLTMAKFADDQWFKIAETLYKDNNLEGRSLVLDQLLQSRYLKSHPKRPLFLKMLGKFLSKGILDERRRIAKYIDDNPTLFSTTDDALYGPLMTAQRDSDTRIANTAESAVKKLRGEDPNAI